MNHLRHIEVVATISNPARYQSRYVLYRKFAEALKQQTIECRLWTIELQHGCRPMEVTARENENHIQLWTSGLPGLLWYKENLQNIAVNYIIQHSPAVRWIAFTDADFLFEPDAFEKTVQALQHYDAVQMYSHIVNLDPDGGILSGRVGTSFMYNYVNGFGLPKKNQWPYYEQFLGSPGGAWAFRRDSLGKMGCALSSPFIDFNIVGGGDHYMAWALIGKLAGQMDKSFAPGYRDSMLQWQDVVLDGLKKNVGYCDNTIRHLWHGRRADRAYSTRWKIIRDYKFDPMTDLKRDVNGIWHLVVRTERQIKMRDALRKYFFSRKEDATTL